MLRSLSIIWPLHLFGACKSSTTLSNLSLNLHGLTVYKNSLAVCPQVRKAAGIGNESEKNYITNNTVTNAYFRLKKMFVTW